MTRRPRPSYPSSPRLSPRTSSEPRSPAGRSRRDCAEIASRRGLPPSPLATQQRRVTTAYHAQQRPPSRRRTLTGRVHSPAAGGTHTANDRRGGPDLRRPGLVLPAGLAPPPSCYICQAAGLCCSRILQRPAHKYHIPCPHEHTTVHTAPPLPWPVRRAAPPPRGSPARRVCPVSDVDLPRETMMSYYDVHCYANTDYGGLYII